MLNDIKLRLGISPQVTVYDPEIEGLIDSAKEDLRQAGVRADLFGNVPSSQAINAVTCYVKSFREPDPVKSARYKKMYDDICFRLTLEVE